MNHALTDSTEEFDAKSSEDVEQEKEEQPEIPNFRQSLHDGVEKSTNRPRQLQQLEHCNTQQHHHGRGCELTGASGVHLMILCHVRFISGTKEADRTP